MGEDKYSEEGLSPAEFTKRGPEADPSRGAAAGPGAPETDEPTPGRDPDAATTDTEGDDSEEERDPERD